MKSCSGGIPHVFEKILALIGLAVCSPALAVAAVLIRVTSPGPALFRQQRVGRFGKHFTLLKFRSMRIHDEGPQVTAKGDSRVTLIGRLLRRSKFDELPELWNVVWGDLSLVGPRPEVPEYVDIDNPLWRKLLETRPGITDPVTLRLRNEEQLLQAFQGDLECFYLNTLQPYKLSGYAEYLHGRTWQTDVRALCQSALAIMFPAKSSTPTIEEIELKLKNVSINESK